MTKLSTGLLLGALLLAPSARAGDPPGRMVPQDVPKSPEDVHVKPAPAKKPPPGVKAHGNLPTESEVKAKVAKLQQQLAKAQKAGDDKKAQKLQDQLHELESSQYELGSPPQPR